MRRCLLALVLSIAGCGGELGSEDAGSDDAARPALDARVPRLDGAIAPSSDATVDPDPDAGPPPEPCATRITYGSRWIRGADHAAQHDDVAGRVTWDGVCARDGANSYATLSNGWRPYFEGPTSCILALDVRGACEAPLPATCTTRVTYGPTWMRAPGHTADHDDVPGVVTWDDICRAASSGNSSAQLSNGWAPHFTGASGCALSFRHEQCGGLFTNAVVATDCPDPGVTHDGTEYVMACTGGLFPLRSSPDLVHWRERGQILPARPGWASDSLWAPEIHRVGDRWIAYYSARRAADGAFALGAATASSALGPYSDLGRPLLTEPHPGIIDAHHFEAPDGRHYLLWKLDGNAVGRSTPIFIQELEDDGVTLRGSRTQLITNDRTWEGALVEGAWMIFHEGTYYLFYSGNGYASASYGVGVARASSPLGPFTKASAPILVSNSSFGGPGHGSILRGPSGDWVHVYHSWLAGSVGSAPGRVVLVDRITWSDGWPHMFSAPSPRSQPLP
ncbi:MAG: glycoside hydrolase family 43 protein [Myxococcota bacterium]|nr:glycoside hydrolase family 43 protein [Myxococcota bacterium]